MLQQVSIQANLTTSSSSSSSTSSRKYLGGGLGMAATIKESRDKVILLVRSIDFSKHLTHLQI